MKFARTVGLASLAIALLAPAPAASAAFGLTGVMARPSSALAGAHSDYTLSFQVADAGHDLRDLTIHMPPGLVGNPRAVPVCTSWPSTAGCRPVGEVSVSARASVLGLELPMAASGGIWSIEPGPSEPARLGIRVELPIPLVGGLIPIVLESPVTVRTSDYGLDATIRDMPSSHAGIPIDVTALGMTLFGERSGMNAPFMTNPTRCVAAQTRIEARSYQAADGTVTASDTFTPTDCAGVPFAPGLDARPDAQAADQPTELSVAVTLPAGERPRRQSHVAAAEVTLPAGTALSPGVAANGLAACADSVFAASQPGMPACPALSEVGTVSFESPLLPPLSGKVFLGEPQPGRMLRLLVAAEGSGVTVKLTGAVRADPDTGQLTTTFADLPQLPFTRFTLAFRGGPTAVLTAPAACASHTVSAAVSPWSRPAGPPAQASDGFATVGCPPPAFAPALTAALGGSQAGAPTTLALAVERPDRQERLRAMRISFPPGLVGALGSVTPCPVATAAAGGCGAGSRVGDVRVVAGTGPAPLALGGSLHLTEPLNGAVAGLAVAVPARVGPLDLGTVTSIAELRVRPGDTGIDVVAPALPRIVGGIPMAIRSLELNVDRDGFMRNATGCVPGALTAAFSGLDGSQATASAPYAATGCASLPFDPGLALRLDASGEGPAVHAVLALRPGSAAASRVAVSLPSTVLVNAAAVARACSQDAYAAGACPESAQVGRARVDTPLLSSALEGPVLLVQGSAPLPDVVAELRGPLPLTVRGSVGFGPSAGIQTVFAGLPDVPLSRFVLDFDGGSDGAVIVGPAACTRRAPAIWELTAHSGATVRRELLPAVEGCVRANARRGPRVQASLAVGGGRGRLVARAAGGGRRLTGLTVGLPDELSVARERLRRATRLFRGSGERVRAPGIAARSHALDVVLPRGRTAASLRLATGALKALPDLRPGDAVRVGFRLRFAGGGSRLLRVRVRAHRL